MHKSRIEITSTKFLSLLISRLFEQYRLWSYGFVALTIIFIVLFSLDKGFGFSDEAWYYLQIKYPESVIALSQWHSYAIKFLPMDIFYSRMINTILRILSGIIFAYGLSKYMRINFGFSVISIAIIGVFIQFAPVQLGPNYITFNTIILFLGSGFYLLALSSNISKSVFIFSLIAAISYSQLLFIMLPNLAIYSILILLPFIIEPKKKARIILLSNILGSFLGIIIFFAFIKGYNEYVIETIQGIDYHAYDNTRHRFMDVIHWCINTLKYFLLETTFPAFLLLMIKRDLTPGSVMRNFGFAVFVAYIFFIVISDFTTNQKNITSSTLLFIISNYIILEHIVTKRYKYAFLGLFLLSIPLFGCLGTNVEFSIRSGEYIMPILLFIVIYSIKERKKELYFLIFILIIYSTGKFVQFTNTIGWYQYVITHQKEPLKKININESIYLDRKTLKSLEEIQSVVNPGDLMLASSNHLLGYIYLSGGKIPLVYFYFNKSLMDEFASRNSVLSDTKKLVLIEYLNAPFPEEFINELKFDKCVNSTLIHNRNIRIILLEKL